MNTILLIRYIYNIYIFVQILQQCPVNLYRCGVVSEKKKDIDEKPEYKTGMIYNSKIVII
jgi:hypothetical protein